MTPRSFVIIADSHFGHEIEVRPNGENRKKPTHDANAHRTLLRFLSSYRPDLVIHAGDLLDLGGISHWHRGKPRLVEGIRIQDGFTAANAFLCDLHTACPRAKYYLTPGNHECFQEDTEILCASGWASIQEDRRARQRASAAASPGTEGAV